MKTILILSLGFLFAASAHAQILKKISNDIKNKAEWKIRSKANQKIDQALDTVLAQPKKITKKNDKSSKKTDTKNQTQKNTEGMNASINNSGEEGSTQGYVTISLSANEIFKGGTIFISGTSLKYGNMTEVKLNIAGPSINQNLAASLNESNGYKKEFQPTTPGEYTITAVSSNGKTKQSAKLKVLEMEMMQWNDNIQTVDKAWNKLESAVQKVRPGINSKHKTELDKKMSDLEDQVKNVKKMFTDLGEAMKQLKNLQISEPLGKHLSELNNVLSEQKENMEKINEINHEPFDNTICEYLVMVNEACAAFQTITNFYATTVKGVLKNIAIDKVIPSVAGAVNDNSSVKLFSKFAGTALFDAEEFSKKIGQAGLAADVVQFVIDILLKTYCGLFTGEMTQSYTETFRNSSNVVWWKYNYETKAAVTFRYPKSQTGKVIKMKGNIEGNATKFSIFQDPEQMDEFEKARGKTKLIPFQIVAPLAVPFATSQYDKLGFGAVARGIATPAYFNIPVDAEFDTENNTIKLSLNGAIVDFLPTVTYKYAYLAIAAGIPLMTVIDFPINKAKLTLNSVVKDNNELQVTKDAKNNLNIKGGGTKHIGQSSSAIEHVITYTLTAKNDN